MKPLRFFINNHARESTETFEVFKKWDKSPLAQVYKPKDTDWFEALSSLPAAQKLVLNWPSFQRKKILSEMGQRILQEKDVWIQLICDEVSKPLIDAEGEVLRAVETFRLAAEVCGQDLGEVLNLEAFEKGTGYIGFTKRVPVGPALLITPYNFPLNLVAHKVAPAIAAGCPFILKPSTLTPLCSLKLGTYLSEMGLPNGFFSIMPTPGQELETYLTRPEIKLVSFTGSSEAGWVIKKNASEKKVVLELGGNAGCLIDETIDVEKIIPRLVEAAVSHSGQSCISLQRILVVQSQYAKTRTLLQQAFEKIKVGSPYERGNRVSALISEKQAEKLESWIQKALQSGAKILAGGRREGNVFQPTLIENVYLNEPLWCEETFGPIAILQEVTHFDHGLQLLNYSRFGLQAGVFTEMHSRAMKAWHELEVGGVMINEVPTWRLDSMPYGGVKDSGFGREGVRYAYEEMTEPRLMVLRT